MCRRRMREIVGMMLKPLVLLLMCGCSLQSYDMPPPCRRLEIESNGYQPAYSGFYVLLENSTMHHRATYRHEVCTFYLYYVDKSPLRFWMLGPVHGGPKGHVMAITDAQAPDMKMDWLTYNGEQEQWAYDDAFEVECLQPEPELVAHWPLNNIYQNRDASPHALNLMAVSMTFDRRSGVRLDQTAQSSLYLDTVSGPSLGLVDDFTISLWFYPETEGGILQWMYNNFLVTTSVGLTIVYKSGVIMITPGYGSSPVSIPYAIIPHKWQHLALTYSAVTNKLTVFNDGLKTLDFVISDLENHVQQRFVHLGASVLTTAINIPPAWSRLGGYLACVRIYKGVLDHKSIAEIMERCEFHHGFEALVAWPLNEESTTTDVIGHVFNLTATGVLRHDAEGVVFLSQDAYSLTLDTRIGPTLTLPADFSVLFWVKPASDGGLIQWNNRLGDVIFNVGLSMAIIGDTLYFFTGFVSSATDIYQVNAPIKRDTWHHVALTYNKNTSHAVIYVDGTKGWEDNLSNLNGAMQEKPYISIGDAYYFNNMQRFSGTIACVMIYDVSLDRDIIMKELQICHGQDLVIKPEAFWPLNYNTTTNDVSSNNFHLTEEGTVMFNHGGMVLVDDPNLSVYLYTPLAGPMLNLAEDFSVVFWVKSYGDGTLLQWANKLGSTVISLGLSLRLTEGKLSLEKGYITADNQPHMVNRHLLKKKWYHVALTYHKVVSRVRIYIEGDMVWHNIMPDLNSGVNQPYMYIGSGVLNDDRKLSGSIACLQIYSIALTKDQLPRTIAICENNLVHDSPVVNWPLNEQFTTFDVSGHGYNLTREGPVEYDHEGVVLDIRNSYALYLDMTQSMVSLDKDFSILFWVSPQTDGGLMQWRDRLGAAAANVGLSLALINSQVNVFKEGATADNLPLVVDAELRDDQWNHIALTFQQNLNTVKIYIDGDLQWNQVMAGIAEAINRPYLYIGAADVFGTFFRLTGKMACFEIFKHYMLEVEVEDVMDSCVSFEVEKKPMVNWPLNDLTTTFDISGNGFNLTKTGVASHDEEGIYLDAASDYLLLLDMTAPPVLELRRDFTIMFWLRPESDGGLIQWDNILEDEQSIGLSMAILGKQLVLFSVEATINQVPLQTGMNFVDYRWYHIALTHRPLLGTTSIHVDGEKQWEQSTGNLADAVSKPALYIGQALIFGSTFRVTTTMACFMIFDYSMDNNEIKQESDKCFIKDQDHPVAYWPLNADATTMDIVGDYNLTSVGLVDHDDEGVIFAKEEIFSLYLDGGNNLGLTQDFSILLWVNYAGDGGLLQWENHLGNTIISVGLSMAILGDNLYIFQGFVTAENEPIEIDYAIMPNRWYHIALVYNSQSVIRVYLDGREQYAGLQLGLNEAVNKRYLNFGSAYIDSYRKMSGKLACVMIYDKVLNADEVSRKSAMCEDIHKTRIMQASWPLNVTTTTEDVSENNFALISEGPVQFGSDGVELHKEDDYSLYLDTTVGPQLAIEHDFSITLWMRLEEDGGIMQWQGLEVVSHGLSLLVVDRKLHLVNGKASPQDRDHMVDLPLLYKKWYHVAVTYNRMLSRAQIFIDGRSRVEKQIPDLNAAVYEPLVFLGAAHLYEMVRMTGKLACVMIYSKVLTGEEIMDYAGMCTVMMDNLVEVAYWPLNQQYKTQDISHHGYDLTAENVAYDAQRGVILEPRDDLSLYLHMTPDNRHLFHGDMSLTFWVYCMANGGIIQFKDGSDPSSELGLSISHFNGDLTIIKGNINDQQNFYSAVDQLNLNTWHHIALVFESSTENVTIFLDDAPIWHGIIVGFHDAINMPYLVIGHAVLRNQATQSSSRLTGKVACLGLYEGMLRQEDITSSIERCTAEPDPEELPDAQVNWPLNEDTTVQDITGNGLNLTVEGTVDHSVEGIILNRVDDYSVYLDTSTGPQLILPGDFSIVFWMHARSDGGVLQWLNKLGSIVISVGLSVAINSDRKLEVFTGFSASPDNIYTIDAVITNKWHHIALTYIKFTSNMTVWIDGMAARTETMPNLNVAVNKALFYIGRAYTSFNLYSQLTGELACFMIFDQVLSMEQVRRATDTCGARILDRSPLANWPLNQRTQTTDITGHGFNLTAAGTLTFEEEGLNVSITGNYLLYLNSDVSESRLSLPKDFTLLFWLYPESEGGLFQFADIVGSIATSVGLTVLFISERLAIYKTVPQGDAIAYEVQSVELVKAKWHHIGLGYHADTSNLTVFVDGHAAWHEEIPGINAATNHQKLFLGAAYFTSNILARFNGKLSCFMVYDVLLHEEEIDRVLRDCESLELDKHPLANWPLDSTAGTMDISGHGNNLTSEGSVAHSNEGVVLALEDDYKLYWNIPHVFQHRLSHDFSLMFWVNPSSDGGLFQFLDGTGATASSVGLSVSLISDKLNIFKEFPSNVNLPDEVDLDLIAGKWHHVTLTYDAHSSELTCYIDGTSIWSNIIPYLNKALEYEYIYLGGNFYDTTTYIGITATLACFRIYGRMLEELEIKDVMNMCDGVLLEKGSIVDWPLDNEFTLADVSDYKYNLTSEGPVVHAIDGMHLDKSDNFLVYLDLTSRPGLQLDHDFSILFWFQPQADGGLFQWLNRLGSTVFSVGLSMTYVGERLIVFNQFIIDVPLEKNLWHHAGLMYHKATSNLTVYIDGRLEWQLVLEDLNGFVQLPFLYIGAGYRVLNSLSRFSGKMACFKIYDRMLAEDDIETIMHMCHNVQLGVRTVAYWPLNDIYQTQDLSGNGFNLTNQGAVFNETRGVSFQQASSEVLFLDTTAGPRLQLLKDFTLTFWMLCQSDGGFLQWLNQDSNAQLLGVGLSFSHFNGALMILEGPAGEPDKIHVIENLVEPDIWYHVALVYDEYRENATLYLDGQARWSQTIPDLTESTDKPYIFLGMVLVVDGEAQTVSRMSGKLACLGIHSGILSEQEVEAELGKCFRDEEPQVLGYWPMNSDTSTADTSGAGIAIINNGVQFDATGITVESGGSSLIYVDLTNGPTFVDGQDLSIALWVYLRSDGGILQWLDLDGTTVERIGLSLVYMDGALRLFTESVANIGEMIFVDDTIQLNPWHHIVLSYDALNSNLTVYIDNIPVFEEFIPDLIASTQRQYVYLGVAALVNGFSYALAGQRLTASLACLGLYQGAFSAEEVLKESDTCESFHIDPALIGFWPLNKVHRGEDTTDGDNTLSDEGIDFTERFGVRLNDSTALYLPLEGGTVPEVLVDFSVTFWVNVQGQGGLLQWVSPSQGSGILLGLSLIYFNNILAVYTNTLSLHQIPNVILLNTWHHFALTYNANSDVAKIYVDGAEVWDKVMPNLENDTYHDFLYIGAAAASAGSQIASSQTRFTGKIACFRIYDGEIGASKVNNLIHDATCPLETEPPTQVAFWPLNQETGVSDTSGNGFNLINNDITFKKVGAEFTSGLDVLFLQLTTETVFNMVDFSISMYIKPVMPGGILQFADVIGTDVLTIGLSIVLEDGLLVIYKDSAPTDKYIQSALLTLSKWQHFLLTYKNKTNEVVVYIDGVDVWTGAIPDLNLAIQKTVLYLGGAVTGNVLPLQLGWINRMLQGKIACLGIYDGVFKSIEVLELMSYCIKPDAVAFWPLNKDDTRVDTTGNGFDLTNQGVSFDQDVGVALTSNTVNQLYLNLNNKPLGLADDITVTFWIYPESSGAIWQFLGLDEGGTIDYVSFGLITVGGVLNIQTGKGFVPAAVMDSIWQHIAVAYDASATTLRVYSDGVLVLDDTDASISVSTSSGFLNIGGVQPQLVSGWTSIDGKIACLSVYGQYLLEEALEEDMAKCSSMIYVIPTPYAYWPLNMESQNADTSGNDRSLIASPAVHFDNLIGVRLVNSSSYMLYHEAPTVQETGDMSILFWIYPNEAGGILQWLNIDDGTASRIWFSIDYMDAGLGLFINNIQADSDKLNIEYILTPRVWNHVALTYLDTNYQLSIFVNGQPVWSSTYTRISTSLPFSHLFIGTSVWNNQETFEDWHRMDGKLACLALYSHALHEAQIKLVMDDCSLETDVPQPKAFWPLNNVDGPTDTTGNGYDMQFFNLQFDQPAGVYFPGNPDSAAYSQITAGENLVLYPDASIAMWIFPGAEGGLLQYLGLNEDLSGFDSVGFSMLYVKGSISIFLDASVNTDDPLTTFAFNENVITSLTWNHVVLSYDGSLSRASLYINGIWEQTRDIPGLAITTNKTNLFLGIVRLTVTEQYTLPYTGLLACLGLYNEVLQEEHVPIIMDMCKVEGVTQDFTTPLIADQVDCDTQPCLTTPCLHGGQCFNEQGCSQFSCFCRHGYAGPLCECPPEFHFSADLETCIKVVTSVKTEYNNGDMYCQSLEQHGHANLAAIETSAKNSFIKGLIACESKVFRLITTASAGKGQLNCEEVAFFTGKSMEQCEEKTCLSGGNAFHHLDSTKNCLIVSCEQGSVATYKGGTNYDVYWLMGYNEIKRESTQFFSSPLIITDFPLQSMHAVIVEIMSISDTVQPAITFTGDSSTTVTLLFNNDDSRIELMISNGLEVHDQFASTDFSNSNFLFNGQYHTYWISWVNGRFEFGTGSDVGINSILYLLDPWYTNSKSYIHTMTLFVSQDGILCGFGAEIHICDGYWTSGRKVSGTAVSFEWGAASEALVYSNWAKLPVSGTLQDCIYMDSDGVWHQEYCNMQMCVVCEVHVGDTRDD